CFPPYSASVEAFDAHAHLLGPTVALAAAIALSGFLLLRSDRASLVGATSVAVLAVFSLAEVTHRIVEVFEEFGPHPDMGFWLIFSGYCLVVIAAAITRMPGVRSLMQSDQWTVRGRATLVGLAGFFGFATAVGYGLYKAEF